MIMFLSSLPPLLLTSSMQLPALVQGLGPVLATASCAEGMCVDAAFNAQREMAIIHALDKRALRQ